SSNTSVYGPPATRAIGGQTTRSGRYRGQVLVNGLTREVGRATGLNVSVGLQHAGGRPCTPRAATGTPTSSGDATAE
ncbi:MAG: hypothetical protein M0Z40_00225, partial [Actinomycetota bacterium]|nr:hypothetical protein [Actinomycetota bacterium]